MSRLAVEQSILFTSEIHMVYARGSANFKAVYMCETGLIGSDENVFSFFLE